MYRKARCWLTSKDRSWPLSFLNVCETLQIAPDQLRTRVLAASPFERQAAIREVADAGAGLDEAVGHLFGTAGLALHDAVTADRAVVANARLIT